MKIGLLTSRFRDKSFEEICEFAGKNGFAALEVNCMPNGHVSPQSVVEDGGKAVRALLDKHGVSISALACFLDITDADEQKRRANVEHLSTTIEAASVLGVEVVTCIPGKPLPGKTRNETIKTVLPDVLNPLAEKAEARGVKLAFEIWWATNVRNPDNWATLFETIPSKALGLNFDPSHLYWQQIDILAAVDEFGDRIYHTHAKDCEVKEHILRRVGNQEERVWWRYVIPGFGGVDWGKYICALRGIGYDGVLSIEHEDAKFTPEEGFLAAKKFLEQYV